MNARPMFLTGWRRILVRLDLHPVEAIALAVLLIVVIGALLLSVVARSVAGPIDCPPPSEHQVLVASTSTARPSERRGGGSPRDGALHIDEAHRRDAAGGPSGGADCSAAG